MRQRWGSPPTRHSKPEPKKTKKKNCGIRSTWPRRKRLKSSRDLRKSKPSVTGKPCEWHKLLKSNESDLIRRKKRRRSSLRLLRSLAAVKL